MGTNDELELLEDDPGDVLKKAAANQDLDRLNYPDTPEAQCWFLKNILGLDPESYLNMPRGISPVRLPCGLTRHLSPFGDWTVNIWTIAAPDGLIAIDTGCSAHDFRTALKDATPCAILITHMDHDHSGGAGAFPSVPVYGPRTLKGGEEHRIGGLLWKIHDLAGHTPDGIGFETECQGQTVFFPGDSIFARSIGKSRLPFGTTIRNILNVLDSLPGNTVICPGHGPATTAEAEKTANPFLAGYYK